MDRRIEDWLILQAGVVSRAQMRGAGATPRQIRRLLDRRELTRLYRGVYVEHTGEPTWEQRAWGAVLAVGPAALWGPSALYREGRPIHVAIDRARSTPAPLPGVRIHHVSDLRGRSDRRRRPPRMHTAAATIDAAGIAGDDLGALAVVAKAVQAGWIGTEALADELARRTRVPRGAWLRAILDDIAAGVCSVLEYGFRDRVLRRHGLPVGVLQQRDRLRASVIYRDWTLGELVVELDGRFHHDSVEAREADFDRDLETAAGGRQTVRISYGQVFARTCLTAAALVRVLRRHGICVNPRPCGPRCPVR